MIYYLILMFCANNLGSSCTAFPLPHEFPSKVACEQAATDDLKASPEFAGYACVPVKR